VKLVGEVPQGLPPLTMPSFARSVGQLIGSRGADLDHRLCGIRLGCADARRAKRQRIDPDQELIGLGAANVGAAFTGGYPVTGGFRARWSTFDAGRETPAAGAYTAVGLAGRALRSPADLPPAARRRWRPPSSSRCCHWWISRS
jgi:SulP family sulfate permease